MVRVRDDYPCLVLGLDPDTGGSKGGSGVCLATTRQVVAVGVASMKAHLGGLTAVRSQRKALRELLNGVRKIGKLDRVAIEIPMDYGQKRFADPNDLLKLSLISGYAAAILDEFCPAVEWVEPYKWKGQRSKTADWRNTFGYFKWDYTWDKRYPNRLPRWEIPTDDVILLSDVTAANKEEIADAMGLAYYALRREGACGE